jgi:hypothetical protein
MYIGVSPYVAPTAINSLDFTEKAGLASYPG